jgi:hypothetical protein
LTLLGPPFLAELLGVTSVADIRLRVFSWQNGTPQVQARRRAAPHAGRRVALNVVDPERLPFGTRAVRRSRIAHLACRGRYGSPRNRGKRFIPDRCRGGQECGHLLCGLVLLWGLLQYLLRSGHSGGFLAFACATTRVAKETAVPICFTALDVAGRARDPTVGQDGGVHPRAEPAHWTPLCLSGSKTGFGA